MSRNKDYQRLLNAPQWAKVKAIVRARAGGLCERCKAEGIAERGVPYITPGVDCHHIRPVEQAKTVEGPDGMRARCYNPNNVMLLCVDCHIKTHREMRSHEGQIAKTLPKDEVKNDRLRQWIAKVSKAPIDENQFKTVKKGIRKTRYGWLTKEEYEKKRAEEHEAWIRRQGNGLTDIKKTASVDAAPED